MTIPSEVAKSGPKRCAAAAGKAQAYRARVTSDTISAEKVENVVSPSGNR